MNEQSERIWAVRGAAQSERNDAESILGATRELVGEILRRNELEPQRIVSCFFTCTEDLNAEFPAVAARELGLDTVPLMCGQEMRVPGAMERVIRVLVHYHAPLDHRPAPVYLGATQDLRSDLH